MAYGESSGTRIYDPFASDLLVDAYDRIGIYDLENKHIISGRRSLNLLMTSSWSNKGINLWEMEEVVFPLIEGVIQYNLTRDVAAVYDIYRRQYSMNQAASYPVSCTTAVGSRNVTIDIADQSSPVGSYIGMQVPIAVGGILLYGFYKVTATPTANSVTFEAADAATATVTDGGVVPQFTTTIDSQNVTVTLPDHGFSGGDPFPVAVATQVGGITLYGSYTIQSITDADNFVILASSNAISGASDFENSGQAFIALSSQVAPYTDIMLTQISRYDYAAQANKTAPGPPTTAWVNRQIIPQMNLWPVTDGTGPYELHVWVMRQVQDVNPTGGQTMNLPPRLLFAATMDLAADLAMKFARAIYKETKDAATAAWMEAQSSDVEPTSTFIVPLLPNGL